MAGDTARPGSEPRSVSSAFGSVREATQVQGYRSRLGSGASSSEAVGPGKKGSGASSYSAWVAETHALSVLLRDAVAGRFPPADGTVQVLPSPPGRSDAVVSFTAHNVIAADLDQGEILQRLPSQDPGEPMSAQFLAWLAGRLGTHAGMIDLVMVAPAPDPAEDLPDLVSRDDLLDHPRLSRSRRYRSDLHCYSDREDRALLVLGKGLADRWEMGIEVEPEFRGTGLGRLLVRAAVRIAPAGEPLFAQISPGNVASVRAFLAAGYKPICSEVVFLRRTRPERAGRPQVTRIPK